MGATGTKGATGATGPAGTGVGYEIFGNTTIGNLGACPGILVGSTGTVQYSGEYFFSASARVSVDAADNGVYCYVSYTSREAVSDGNYGASTTRGKRNEPFQSFHCNRGFRVEVQGKRLVGSS
jgi:hypothetical protein